MQISQQQLHLLRLPFPLIEDCAQGFLSMVLWMQQYIIFFFYFIAFIQFFPYKAYIFFYQFFNNRVHMCAIQYLLHFSKLQLLFEQECLCYNKFFITEIRKITPC